MQIALIADHLGLPGAPCADAYPGDDCSAVLCLAEALAALDLSVTIYARKDAASLPGKTSVHPGVTAEYIEAGPVARLPEDKLLPHIAAFSGQLADCWQRAAPAVVHGLSWTSGMAALAGARELRIPVVQTYHSAGSSSHHARRLRSGGAARFSSASRARLEAAAGRTADTVLAGSTADVTELARMGVHPTSIKLVPPGVDTELFRPSGPAARRGSRARLLMITSMADGAEPAIVLRALAHLPDAELVIAGGPARSALARDRGCRALTRLARQLGLTDRLVFTGKLRRADVPTLLRSADLVVNLTATHPFDTVTLDAMACGVPVLATAAGLHEDAVIDGITGFLVRSATPLLVADRIRTLLASPMLREGYGIAAASRAQERYSWTRIGLEMVTIYQALVSHGADTSADAAA
jgi:D-inositol-3-phosphate glycosyltransferase